jgi:signal transduction histidine kinase
MIKTQSQRIAAIINYVVFAIVLVRALLEYGGEAELAQGLVPLLIFLVLLVTEPYVSRRWRAYRGVYFGLQTALVMRVGFLASEFDFLWNLYIILGIYAFVSFPRRTAATAIGVLIVIAGVFLMTAIGTARGLAILLNIVAVGYFLVSFTQVSAQAEVARNESAALLSDLQKAHAQLQDYADRAEELSAVRERNRVARELHDSVNQSIFSITLTAEAARTMLDRDPARVPPYLDQLQEMTTSALAQLRSLIGQLRPKSAEPPQSEVEEQSAESTLR